MHGLHGSEEGLLIIGMASLERLNKATSVGGDLELVLIDLARRQDMQTPCRPVYRFHGH